MAHAAVAKKEGFNRLGTDNITKLLFEFSIPALVGIVVQALYNIVDSIYVGHGVGPLGLASTTVSLPMMTLMMALAMLVGAGGNALAAIRLGEGNKDEAERILGNSFALFFVMYIVTLIVFFLFMEPILRLSGATDEVMDLSKTFLGIIMFGFLFQALGFGLNNFIRTAGNPNRALFTMVLGAVVNAILGYLFVLVFEWGIAGAAWATFIAWVVSAISVIEFFIGKDAPLRLRKEHIRIDPKLAVRILGLGIAPAVLYLGITVVTTIENQMLVRYGALDPELGDAGALAVMGVVGRISMLVIVPAMGFSMGAQPIVGYNYGAHQYKRMKSAVVRALLFSTIPIVVFWLLVMTFPSTISALFGLPEHYHEVASAAIRLNMLAGPLFGYLIVASNYFQATGQALKAAVLTATRQILFLIPLIIFTPVFLPKLIEITPILSVFLAPSISDFVSAAFITLFFIPDMRRLTKLEDETDRPQLDADGNLAEGEVATTP